MSQLRKPQARAPGKKGGKPELTEEQKQEIREAFDLFDTDGSGARRARVRSRPAHLVSTPRGRRASQHCRGLCPAWERTSRARRCMVVIPCQRTRSRSARVTLHPPVRARHH